MDKDKVVNLAARRTAAKREQRSANLSRWKPSLGLMMWGGFLAVGAVTYFLF